MARDRSISGDCHSAAAAGGDLAGAGRGGGVTTPFRTAKEPAAPTEGNANSSSNDTFFTRSSKRHGARKKVRAPLLAARRRLPPAPAGAETHHNFAMSWRNTEKRA
jgi:hypothetical protein